MGINNWTVRTSQIHSGRKGLSNRNGYLMGQNRKAHAGTTIVKLGGSHMAILDAHSDRQQQRRDDGLRGGGVRNLATEFSLTLPAMYGHPSPEQWKEAIQPVLKAIGKELGVNPKTVAKHCVAVLHDEHKSGKASHVHLMVSNIMDGTYHKKLTRKDCTAKVKKAHNVGVLKAMGIDWRKHEPEETGVGHKDIWLIRKERALEKEAKASVDHKRASEHFDYANERGRAVNKAIDKNIDIAKQANEEGRKLKKVGKVLKSYARNLKKWFESQDEKEELKLAKKMQKQVNDVVDYGHDDFTDFDDITKEAEKKKRRSTNVSIPKPKPPGM